MSAVNSKFTAEINRFERMNQRDSPATMPDGDLPILINYMPIGTSLYALPGFSSPHANAITPIGTTIKVMFFAFIGTSQYCFAVTTDGAMYRFDVLNTWTRVKIAAAGTFNNPYFELWQFTYVLIIDTTGYFSYSGVSAAVTALGIAIGTTVQKVKTTVAGDFTIGNVTYNKIITDDLWTLTGFNCTNKNFNKCYLYLSSTGVASIASGVEASDPANVVMPPVDGTLSLVGILQVNPTGTGNFTGGTTALNDGTVVPNASFEDNTCVKLHSNNAAVSIMGVTIATADKTKARTSITANFKIGVSSYSKAATDNLWTLPATTVTNGKFNKFRFFLDAAGAASADNGVEAATLAGVIMPPLPLNKALVGTLTVNPTGTGNFVGATTAIDSTVVKPNAVFTDNVIQTPTTGTSIAVWQDRVWLATGSSRTLIYSAVDDPFDFTSVSAGAFVDPYSDLRAGVTAIKSSGGSLYIVGDHAVHQVDGLQVLSDGTTFFRVIDSVPGIGGTFARTVVSLGGPILFGGDTGIHAVSGTASEQLSDLLDSLYLGIDQTFEPVAAIAEIYFKLVYCYLVRVRSILDGSLYKWMLCNYEGRWFIVDYSSGAGGVSLNTIADQGTSSDTKTFGAYSNTIVQLFNGSNSITHKCRTRAMNFGSPINDKQILRAGALVLNTFGVVGNMSMIFSIIGDVAGDQKTVAVNLATVALVNQNNVPFTFTGGFTFIAPSSEALTATQIDGRGKRIQIDIEETSGNTYVLTGILAEGQYVAPW